MRIAGPNAPILTNLPPQKRVYVAGAVGDYLKVESVRGNPPGYIARKDVARIQGEPQSTGGERQSSPKETLLAPKVSDAEQKVEEKKLFTKEDAEAEMSKYQNMAEAYQKAMSMANLGMAHLNTGRYQEALEKFQQAISLKPDFAEAHYNLGAAYERIGRRQEAKEERDLAIGLDPYIGRR